MSEPGRTRLTSWKEIAAHLRREVRTVIRWEKERGLPVHRIPGGQGRSVFAFTDELDAWAAGESAVQAAREVPAEAAGTPASPAPTRGLLPRHGRLVKAAAGAIMIVVVAAVTAAVALRPAHRDIARVAIADRSVDALDPQGRVLWSAALPGQTHTLVHRQTGVIDLTRDGRPDVVASVDLAATLYDTPAGSLFAFDADGKTLWQRSLTSGLSFGRGSYEPPWQPDDLMTFAGGGEPYVAWSVHHLTWWPSLLMVFDGRGSRIGAFVNAGWIRTSRASADGRQIITGGFSNSRQGAAFAVLDARHPDGSSPEETGSPYECRNCPAGRPLHYFVVDWSDIATSLPPDERDVAVNVSPASGAIELRAQQRRSVELIVELSPSFEMIRGTASDAFWEWHRRLEREGQLTHDRQHCPYRNGPVVREWTPERGWREIRAAPR